MRFETRQVWRAHPPARVDGAVMMFESAGTVHRKARQDKMENGLGHRRTVTSLQARARRPTAMGPRAATHGHRLRSNSDACCVNRLVRSARPLHAGSSGQGSALLSQDGCRPSRAGWEQRALRQTPEALALGPLVELPRQLVSRMASGNRTGRGARTRALLAAFSARSRAGARTFTLRLSPAVASSSTHRDGRLFSQLQLFSHTVDEGL
jgi:hypothetical protein